MKRMVKILGIAIILSFTCKANAWTRDAKTRDYDWDGTRQSYDCDGKKIHSVPDAGATLLLFGTALTGIGAVRRFMRN